jgi:hypothetical protein
MKRHRAATWTFIALGLAALSYAATSAQKPSEPTLTAEDYVAIQQLTSRYSFALDTGADNGYMYADLYTPDGNFGKTVGRDELAKLARGGRRGPMNVRNMGTFEVIKPAPGGATGHIYQQAINFGERDKKTSTEVDHYGRYEDVFVKTPDGWRFKSRTFINESGGLRPASQRTSADSATAPAAR